MTLPTRVNQAMAIAAVQEFLDDPDWQRQIAEYGWEISRIAALTLIVALRAKPLGATAEVFTLRLICDHYPTYPPDIQFVNPATYQYAPDLDLNHVARLEAQDCYVHPRYGYQNLYPYGPQLVCSSVTLGYYFSNHTPMPDQAWQPGRHRIGTSIYTVYRTLHSSDYNGRHGG